MDAHLDGELKDRGDVLRQKTDNEGRDQKNRMEVTYVSFVREDVQKNPSQDFQNQSLNWDAFPKEFASINQALQSLFQLRIIEKLCRPVQLRQKQFLMVEVNAKLDHILKTLDRIKELSKRFKEGEYVSFPKKQPRCNSAEKQNSTQLIRVGSSMWKQALYVVCCSIRQFYAQRMLHFKRVNQAMQLGLELVTINTQQWKRQCLAIMKTHSCICG